MIYMAFDKKLIRYRGKPIETRYDNIRAPNLRPQIRVQALDPFNSGNYGPIQIVFDLYNMRDPKKSKPLAFANLTIQQTQGFIVELIKALSVLDPIRTPDEIAKAILSEVKTWYYLNRRKIEVGKYVEG